MSDLVAQNPCKLRFIIEMCHNTTGKIDITTRHSECIHHRRINDPELANFNPVAALLAAIAGSFLGIVVIIPLRKQMIEFDRLKFPSGIAVASLLRSPGAGERQAKLLAGGFIGNNIGRKLDCADQDYHYDTTQSALEYKKTGRSAGWSNPDSGHAGSVTPTKTFFAADGRPCREFTQTIFVDGKEESVTDTACRGEDGTWKIVDS